MRSITHVDTVVDAAACYFIGSDEYRQEISGAEKERGERGYSSQKML